MAANNKPITRVFLEVPQAWQRKDVEELFKYFKCSIPEEATIELLTSDAWRVASKPLLPGGVYTIAPESNSDLRVTATQGSEGIDLLEARAGDPPVGQQFMVHQVQGGQFVFEPLCERGSAIQTTHRAEHNQWEVSGGKCRIWKQEENNDTRFSVTPSSKDGLYVSSEDDFYWAVETPSEGDTKLISTLSATPQRFIFNEIKPGVAHGQRVKGVIVDLRTEDAVKEAIREMNEKLIDLRTITLPIALRKQAALYVNVPNTAHVEAIFALAGFHVIKVKPFTETSGANSAIVFLKCHIESAAAIVALHGLKVQGRSISVRIYTDKRTDAEKKEDEEFARMAENDDYDKEAEEDYYYYQEDGEEGLNGSSSPNSKKNKNLSKAIPEAFHVSNPTWDNPPPSRRLVITGLPNMNDAALVLYFSRFENQIGDPVRIAPCPRVGVPEKICVTFTTQAAADQALFDLNNEVNVTARFDSAKLPRQSQQLLILCPDVSGDAAAAVVQNAVDRQFSAVNPAMNNTQYTITILRPTVAPAAVPWCRHALIALVTFNKDDDCSLMYALVPTTAVPEWCAVPSLSLQVCGLQSDEDNSIRNELLQLGVPFLSITGVDSMQQPARVASATIRFNTQAQSKEAYDILQQSTLNLKLRFLAPPDVCKSILRDEPCSFGIGCRFLHAPEKKDALLHLHTSLGTIRFRNDGHIWRKYWRKVQLLNQTNHAEVFSASIFSKEGDFLRTNAPCIVHLDDLLPSVGLDHLKQHVASAEEVLRSGSFNPTLRPELCSGAASNPRFDSEDGSVPCKSGDRCLRLHLKSTRVEFLRNVYESGKESPEAIVGKVFSQGPQVFFVANPDHAASAAEVSELRNLYQVAHEAVVAEDQLQPGVPVEGGGPPPSPAAFDFSAFENPTDINTANEGIVGAPVIAIDPIGTLRVDDAFRIRVLPTPGDPARYGGLKLSPQQEYKELLLEVFVPEIWSRIVGTATSQNPLVSDAELAAVREMGERWPKGLEQHCSLTSGAPCPCLTTTTGFVFDCTKKRIVGVSHLGITRGFVKLNWQLDYDTADQILESKNITNNNSLQSSLRWADTIAQYLDFARASSPAQAPNLFRTPSIEEKPKLDKSYAPFVLRIRCGLKGDFKSHHIVGAFTELSNKAATKIFLTQDPLDPRIIVHGCPSRTLAKNPDLDLLGEVCAANANTLSCPHANHLAKRTGHRPCEPPSRTFDRNGIRPSGILQARGQPPVGSEDKILPDWQASPEFRAAADTVVVDVNRPLRRFEGAFHQYLLLRIIDPASFPDEDFPQRGQVLLAAAAAGPDLGNYERGVDQFVEKWIPHYYRFCRVLITGVSYPSPPSHWETIPDSGDGGDGGGEAEGHFPVAGGGGGGPPAVAVVTVHQLAGYGAIDVPLKNCAPRMNLAVGQLVWMIICAPRLHAIGNAATRLELCETLPDHWLSSQVLSCLTDWEE